MSTQIPKDNPGKGCGEIQTALYNAIHHVRNMTQISPDNSAPHTKLRPASLGGGFCPTQRNLI
jgi:hypothetical protein